MEDYGTQLDAQARDWLNRIRSSSQRMAELIDDLLSLSRIGRTDLKRQMISLSDMAISTGDRLKGSDVCREVNFIIEPNLMVFADASLLLLVLDNLMGNAFKYTGRRPEAIIEFGSTRVDGITTYFVKDNGTGFDMKYADKLFQPFQRLHNDKDYPGTGIGLVTVSRIINRHGGEVWAAAELGKGATFYFTLGDQRRQ